VSGIGSTRKRACQRMREARAEKKLRLEIAVSGSRPEARGLLQSMVFPDNLPGHTLRGEPKGIEHVLQEHCLWPENNRQSDDRKFLL
jgi:hypothetical protein